MEHSVLKCFLKFCRPFFPLLLNFFPFLICFYLLYPKLFCFISPCFPSSPSSVISHSHWLRVSRFSGFSLAFPSFFFISSSHILLRLFYGWHVLFHAYSFRCRVTSNNWQLCQTRLQFPSSALQPVYHFLTPLFCRQLGAS